MTVMDARAIETRCTIIRFIARKGGVVEGMKVNELAAAMKLPYESLKKHTQRLEAFGVLEIERKLTRGEGRTPNKYTLLRTEKWFRDHADELDGSLRKRARESTIQIRRAEEERLLARRSRRQVAEQENGVGINRQKRGLPRLPPPEGEPEPKSVPVSDALREALIEEGMNLPAEELAKWGAANRVL